MKVYIVMQTIIGDWMEDFHDSTFIKAVFSSEEDAKTFMDLQPKTIESGYAEVPVQDEDGEQIGVDWVPMYETKTYYVIHEHEVDLCKPQLVEDKF